jgi:hypothetical protein
MSVRPFEVKISESTLDDLRERLDELLTHVMTEEPELLAEDIRAFFRPLRHAAL